MVESVIFLTIATVIDKKHAKAFLAGGILEMVITEAEYLYARQLGLTEIDEPTTEEYGKQEGGFVYG